jgi:hypothetical protein
MLNAAIGGLTERVKKLMEEKIREKNMRDNIANEVID